MVPCVRREPRGISEIETSVGDDLFQVRLRNNLLHQPFDLRHDGCGLLDPRSFGSCDQHREIARVDFGKELGMEVRDQ